jgi:signal peptidase II
MRPLPGRPQGKIMPTEKKKKAFVKYPWSWSFFFTSFLWLAALLFILDLASKWAVQLNLSEGAQVSVIPNFFYITLVYNTGAAFSFGASASAMRYVYIAISWVMTLVIGYYWYGYLAKKDKLINAIFALLFAGALGNLIDRTFYFPGVVGFDGVVDFLEFYLGGGPSAPTSGVNPFAIFNVADSCLTIGVIMALIVLLIRAIKSDLKKTPEQEQKEQLGEGENHEKDDR